VLSASPKELNAIAAGGDVKSTVMIIPSLRTCVINMIADLERKFTSNGNKNRALLQPEAPWNWFTSYELGFPQVSDELERPMHPLVKTFVDEQIQAYLTEEEEANASSTLPPLIGLLRTIKEGWGDQASTELLPIANRAATREMFSTSHIAIGDHF